MDRFRSSVTGAAVLLISTLFLLTTDCFAQNCDAFPDGGTLTGVVNTYYLGRGTNSAGATRVRVYTGTMRGAGQAIAADTMLLVIQTQDADINADNTNLYGDGVASNPANGQTALNSSGYFEYVVAQGAPSAQGYVDIIGSGTGYGLLHTYRQATGPPQRTFQVIIVPRYKTATLSSTLTASAWNGQNGGVLALDVTGTLTLGGTVSLDGLGFRGGAGRALAGGGGANTDYRTLATVNTNGAKGEGIAGTQRYVFDGAAVTNTGVEGYTNGTQARGGPGNAAGGGTDGNPAGNDQNSGGGGGGNGGQGGYGGNSWNSNLAAGGHPGAVFPYAVGTNARIAMGGGGGAGSRNNSAGFQSSGGLGGGIAIIRTTYVSGTGTITANGRGRDIANVTPDNDGAGGGGAGGTIVVATRGGTLSGLTVQATGGGGVDAWPTQAPGGTPGNRHGPGGGGGGGVILLSSAPASSNVSGGVNGTTTTAVDPFGATAGSPGTVQTGIAYDQLPGVQSCNNYYATRATIRGIQIDRSGLVEFATESQQGSTAFRIWQTSDPTGREGRQLLSWDPVASLPLTSLEPVVYRVPTRPVTAPYLLIEEIDARGVRRMMGPFPVRNEHLAEEFRNTEARIAENGALKAAAKQAARRSRLDGANPPNATPLSTAATTTEAVPMAVKIEVSSAGTVRVPVSELVSLGMPATLVNRPDRLHLTSFGLAVPFSIVAGSGGASVLQFSADTIATDYTNRNVYLLSWRRNPFAAPSTTLTRSGFAPVPGMVRIERNRFYAPFAAPGADPWIWDFIDPFSSPQTISFDVPRLASPGTEPVPVRIGFSGAGAHNHTVRATLNGQAVGVTTFAGRTAGMIEGQVPAGTVLGSGNQLTIEYTASPETPDDAGLIFLDAVDLGVRLEPVVAAVPVDRMTPFAYTRPPMSGVDYLIVTHGLFAEGAQRIAEQKRREGYNPAVVDVELAYNRFSAGVVEPNAVRKLLIGARSHSGGALRYVLLVGDDTFDPKNNLGRGLVSFIPSLNGMDEVFGRIPSENRYADVNENGSPELAIGRLPVSTTDQMEVMVDKIIRQDELLAAGKGRHLFAVDNPGEDDPDFRQWAARVAAALPQETAVKWADVSEGAATARSALLQSLRTGAEATHYFGHGGFEIWTDDGLLTASDADAAAGSGVGTVLFTWACQVQWYQYHLGLTINEALLLAPNGGAVAAVGPAGITEPESQRILYANVYANLMKGMTLGEAIRRAKIKAIRAGSATRPVVEGFNLLGDPSLRLNWSSLPGAARATTDR